MRDEARASQEVPPHAPAHVVEFTATRADMAAFQRFVTRSIRRSVRSPLYWAVLVLLAVIVGGLLRGVPGVRFDRPTALLVLGLGAAFWVIISTLYRAAATPVDGGSLIGMRRIELDDDGVRQIAPVHQGSTAWAGVLAVHETPTHVLLMTDLLAGYIIPKRAFQSAEQERAFIGFAHARARPR